MRALTRGAQLPAWQIAIVALLIPTAQQSHSAAAQNSAAPATIDPKVTAILRASCDTLMAAQTMTFTAMNTYERSASNGQPLYSMVLNRVTLQRPDKLRALRLMDGIPKEFYYDGKTITVYLPSTNVVSVADAPPTIDQMLDAAWDVAGVNFSFANVIDSKPCALIDQVVKSGSYVGQSSMVGGTTTDRVIVAGDKIQAEVWIGATDHLPRMVRATYPDIPTHPRYETDYSDWHLGAPVDVADFASVKAATAKHIPFEPPGPGRPPGMLTSHAAAPENVAPEKQPLPSAGEAGEEPRKEFIHFL
jgi:hypothetical protein